MTTNIQIRVDTDLKKRAEKALELVGLDLPTAFRAFLKKVTSVGGMPFDLRVEDSYYKFSKQQEQQIREATKDSYDLKNWVGPFDDSKSLIKSLRKNK